MDRLPVLIAVLAALALAAPATAVVGAQSGNAGDCGFPVERTDATGTDVILEEEPQRVVTLNPSAAQTMWEIGAKDKVVGVTKYAANLEGAEQKTNISGSGRTISNEEVVGLNPDLVLVPNATLGNDHIQTLRDSGLTVYHFREAESIDDIKAKTELIGRLVGACDGAAETVAWMESELQVVDEAVADEPRPTALYQFFGFTAGSDTFINRIIERAGANNLAKEVGISGYAEVNPEVIANSSLDWLIRNTDDPNPPSSPVYNETRAVQGDQVVVVNTDLLNRPGPRVVKVVSQLAQEFHPEAYAAANATATPSPTPAPTPTATANDDDTPTPTPTGASGPGFGVVAGLLALLGSALVADRRR
jgi:iron complex transport system substrate-binding protein